MRKGIMSLENLDDFEQTQVAGSGFQITDAEDKLADTIGCNDQLQQSSDDLTQGATVATTLLAIQDNLTEPGELTEAGAKALDIAVEHLCRSVGFRKSPLPALESYSSDKAHYKQLALEGIGDFLKRMFRAIIEAIKKAIQFIIDFIATFLLSTKSLLKRVDLLSKEANALSNKEAANEDVIESKRISKFLESKKGFITNAEFNSAYDEHDSIITGIFDNAVSLANSTCINLKEAYKKCSKIQLGNNRATLELILNEAYKPLASDRATSSNLYKNILDRFDDNNVVTAFPLIFNKSALYISLISNKAPEEKLRAAINKVSIFIEPDTSQEHNVKNTVRVLIKHDILTVLGSIKGNLIGTNTQHTKLNKLVDELKSLTSTIQHDFNTAQSNTYINADTLNIIYAIATAVTRFTTSGIPGILKYNLVVDKYALDYAAASIAKLRTVGEKSNAELAPFSHSNTKLLH